MRLASRSFSASKGQLSCQIGRTSCDAMGSRFCSLCNEATDIERDMEPNVAVLTFVLLTASSSLKPKRSCTGSPADQPVSMLALKLPAGSALDVNGSHLAGDDALDMIVPVNHDKMPQAHGPKHCVSALNGERLLD